MRENSWLSYTDEDDKNVEVLAGEYKEFLSKCKTERECTEYFTKEAEACGYQDLNKLIAQGTRLKAGDKVYGVGMGKTIALFQIGKQPLTEGMNILCAHIDSPRLDLKQNPLYEDTELSFMDTHYYGGIKKYQWVALPLALHGVVAKKDGTVISVNVGEDPADPVVYVTDLLIHLAGKQMEKKGSVVVEGENLDILVGSRPLSGEEKDAVKAGGGYNHRYNLSDGVLLKDNHIGAAGSVAKAVEMAKEYCPFVRKIEIEVENLDMVKEAADAGADIIMLDNMSHDDMKEAIRIIDGRAETECSGNVTRENIAKLIDLGVDYISSGALTHSAPIMDISLKNLHATE